MCPDGFRLPTAAELNIERTSWGPETPNAAQSFAAMQITTLGHRRQIGGALSFVGEWGYYWGSEIDIPGYDDADTYYTTAVALTSHWNAVGGTFNSFGAAVRCIQD